MVAGPAPVGEPDVVSEVLGALDEPVGGLAAERPGAGVRPSAQTAPTQKIAARTRPRTRCTTTDRGTQLTPVTDVYVPFVGLCAITRPRVDWLFMRSCRILGMRTTATLFTKYFTCRNVRSKSTVIHQEGPMVSISRRRALVAALVLGSAVAVAPLAAVDAAAAPATGTVYVVQGVADTPMTITVDGKAVATGAAAKTIVGPLALTAGNHTVTAESPSGTASVTASVSVAAGTNVDTVVHRQVDPSKPPVITTFPNDLSSVAAGSGRLVVAHTAAVGPADVRVDQKVLFANIANGEALTVTVPAGGYTVDIVPTATTGPVVFGPANVPVAATSLTRVFAIGVAANSSMDAVVQVLPLAVRGSGTTPNSVNAGDGGQAAGLIAAARGSDDSGPLAVLLVVALAGVAVLVGSRRRPVPARSGGRS